MIRKNSESKAVLLNALPQFKLLLILSIMLCLVLKSYIAAASTKAEEGSLNKKSFEALKVAWETNPGAMVNNSDLMEQLSPEQMSELVEHKDTSHYSFMHMAVIKGDEFKPAVLGLANDKLSIMVVMDNQMKAIPFQIDETDIHGLTIMPNVRKYEADGEEGLFDKQDEVVFMYRDANFEQFDINTTSLESGEILQEIEFNYPNRKPRYAYLVKGNNQRSDIKYVEVNIKEGSFNSTYFTITWNPKNLSDIRYVSTKIGPKHGANIIDNVYFELSTGIFNKYARVGFNSRKHILASIADLKAGPIRITALIKSRLKFIGIPSPSPYYLNMVLGEQSLNFKSRSTPDGYKYAKYMASILKEPGFYVSVDFHNMNGAKVSFDSISKEADTPVIDGKMSKLEHKMNSTRLPGDWLWIESDYGWSVFLSNNLPIIENGLFDAFLKGLNFRILYEDDLTNTNPFERYPGAGPRIGMEAKGLPKIALEMLSATSDISWEDIHSLQNMTQLFIAASETKRFKKLNLIISEVLIQERDQGRISNSQELAEAFIADFNLIGIRGVNREKFNKALSIGIGKIQSFETFNLGKVIKDIQLASEALGIDSSVIHYAPRDNALWFPDSVGENGPNGFRHEVNNPPQFTIHEIAIEK